VVRANRRGGELCKRGVIKDKVQPPTVDAHLGKFISGQLAARFLVNELPKTVEEAALDILNSGREQFVRDAQSGKFSHRMRQQGDTDPELSDLGCPFVDMA
jgi:hypothetical protein